MTNAPGSLAGSPVLSLREGASVVGLGILGPLAIQGVLLSALWTFAQFGSDSPALIGGVPFELGSTLSVGVAILVVLVVRFVAMWVYWFLIVERFGEPRGRAILASLPIAGLWWSVKISSRIARGIDHPRRLSVESKVVTAGALVLAILLLPLSMQMATAMERSEAARLAEPCIDLFPATTVEESVITVGKRQMARGTFDALVDDVVSQQRGAVAKQADYWPRVVATNQIQMFLLEEAAGSVSRAATVARMDQQIADWVDFYGTRQDLVDALSSAGYAVSQLQQLACSNVLSGSLAEQYSTDPVDDGPSEYDTYLRETAERIGVTVDPEIGFWDVNFLTVVQDEPLSMPGEEDAAQEPEVPESPQDQGEDASEPSVAQETTVEREFSTRVEYDIASIPTGEFTNSLAWQADICAGATELLQDRFRERVELFVRDSGIWVRVQDAQADVEAGGRCDAGQVNILIGSTEEEPADNWTDKGWKTCRPYQVRIPETPTFQATSVDLCVSARADSASEGV